MVAAKRKGVGVQIRRERIDAMVLKTYMKSAIRVEQGRIEISESELSVRSVGTPVGAIQMAVTREERSEEGDVADRTVYVNLKPSEANALAGILQAAAELQEGRDND